MQDLEELKKEIEIQKTVSGNLFVTYFETIESVITRCESAEKEVWRLNQRLQDKHQHFTEACGNLDIAQQELKELREQKPVAWVCEYSHNPWPNGGGRRFGTKELAENYLNTPLGCSYDKVSPIYRYSIVMQSNTDKAD